MITKGILQGWEVCSIVRCHHVAWAQETQILRRLRQWDHLSPRVLNQHGQLSKTVKETNQNKMLNQEEWKKGDLSKASQHLLPFPRMALTQKGESQKMTESRGYCGAKQVLGRNLWKRRWEETGLAKLGETGPRRNKTVLRKPGWAVQFSARHFHTDLGAFSFPQ